ncbi:MAG: hypothetical protein ACE5DX_02140 [Candidatus Dojkabacteria bacterium]
MGNDAIRRMDRVVHRWVYLGVLAIVVVVGIVAMVQHERGLQQVRECEELLNTRFYGYIVEARGECSSHPNLSEVAGALGLQLRELQERVSNTIHSVETNEVGPVQVVVPLNKESVHFWIEFVRSFDGALSVLGPIELPEGCPPAIELDEGMVIITHKLGCFSPIIVPEQEGYHVVGLIPLGDEQVQARNLSTGSILAMDQVLTVGQLHGEWILEPTGEQEVLEALFFVSENLDFENMSAEYTACMMLLEFQATDRCSVYPTLQPPNDLPTATSEPE